MEWTQFWTILGLIATGWFYLGSQMNGIRSEMRDMRKEMHEESIHFHQECRDFHGRLVSLEERYREK